jgi:hypothetical protein
MPCGCCGTGLTASGSCPVCDATMSSPPHVCLRWLAMIGDEGGCLPAFSRLHDDHETAWRLDLLDGPSQEGAER